MSDSTTYSGLPVHGLTLEKLARLTSNIFNVKVYGATGDGVTDDTTVIQAAINAAAAAGGGTLFFPAGIYRINGTLDTLPNDGATPVPGQNTLRFIGAGMGAQATLGLANPNGATVLELRGTTGTAKIDSRGRGLLEIRDMTLSDQSGDATPFIQVTNTVLRLINVEMWGSKPTTTADQDGVVLGGTDTTIDASSNAPFQGYGTVISGCHFQRIRRAVYGRVYCNAVVIRDNTVWATCGSNLTEGAPIEFDGDPLDITTERVSGILLMGNLLEVYGYTHAYKFRAMSASTIGPDNVYDPGASFSTTARFEQGASYNTIVAGFYPDVYPFVEEVSTAVETNTIVDGHNARETIFSQFVRFRVPIHVASTAVENVEALKITNQSGDIAGLVYNFGTAMAFRHTPSGGAEQYLFEVKDFGSGTVILYLKGTDTRIRSDVDFIKLDNATEINGLLSFGSAGNLQVRTFTNATRPAAGTIGRTIFNSNDGQLNIDDGSNWTLPDGTTT